MWEDWDLWEKRINDFVETHDVVEIAPIGMDGVMVRYKPIEILGKELQYVKDHAGPVGRMGMTDNYERFTTSKS